ncbi:MAG: 1-(5-phosphoribosyl)-5-[(5-phosphoribosylamino)methylideneamino]imidazole-4-carboxamide isomerase [Balneolaceae bacterium]|nr:1-(5-phosphoribosyl)-5-[(5-phosphoribosylamino)methylideneamino]imidazole-4-carboxamide isomerase [Balneolaceae bacterium]
MNVIPAIDLLDGRVVRLTKGDYEKVTVYNNRPLEEARTFADAGFRFLHVVDLNGAREGAFVNLSHITRMVEETGVEVQAGGGVRSYDDALRLLEAGVSRVICSSLAVRKPKAWYRLLEEHPGRAVLGMDLKEGRIAYSGWEKTSAQSIDTFLQPMIDRGLQYVLCTDIARDGTLEGPNIALYRDLQEQYPELYFIASGGVSSAADLQDLREVGLAAAVVGRAYYEKKVTLDELKLYT